MRSRASALLGLMFVIAPALAQTPQRPVEVVVTPAGGSKDPRESAICVKPVNLADAACPWYTRVVEDEPGAIRNRVLGAQVSADGSTLFAVLRKQSGTGMTDELWRYRRGEAPRRIGYGDPLAFAISADGRVVAFKTEDGILHFVDAAGRDLGDVNLASIDAQGATLAMRDGDLAVFVANRGLGEIERVLVVDVPNRQVVGYYLGGLYVGAEYAIDPRGRRLAFSDYPRGLDAAGAARVKADGQLFKLQVIDLESRSTLFTAERVGEPFRPVWFGNRLNYADREGPKRLDKSFDGTKP